MLLSQDLEQAHPGGQLIANLPGDMTSRKQEFGSISTESIPIHPLGVKPLGNKYFSQGPDARQTLGTLGRLPDELIQQILEEYILDANSLRCLGSTCKFLYCFCSLDELWKAIFLSTESSSSERPKWRGTWRNTISKSSQKETKLDCGNVFSDVIHRPFACSHVSLKRFTSHIPQRNQMSRLSKLSHEEFLQDWSDTPFILTDYIKSWPVYKDWNILNLKEKYSAVKFRAEAVDWPFSVYHEYCVANQDESPLYLFDRKFAEKMGLKVRPNESAAYWPPECFGEDVFQLLREERPAHRWLIIGPERSGSTFHKDPNGTNAWNAVIQGSKYWLMFPPSVPQPPGVFVSEDKSEVTSPLSIAEYLLTFHAEARQTAGCVEGICKAGELLFVPNGWWHLVVNLEGGIALTQNFVTDSRKHLAHVLSFLKDKPDQVTGFSRDIESPYDLFVNRLRERRSQLLDEAFDEIERKANGKKRRWEVAVGPNEGTDESSGGGFSFGFGEDEEDIP